MPALRIVINHERIACWRKLSASSTGEMHLLQLQLLREDPLAFVLSPDQSLSDLVFDVISRCRQIPRKEEHGAPINFPVFERTGHSCKPRL